MMNRWIEEAVVRGIEAGFDWKPEAVLPPDAITSAMVEAAAIAVFDRMKMGNLSHVSWYAAKGTIRDEWRAAMRHALEAAAAAYARELE
jgi:hypothetical protein